MCQSVLTVEFTTGYGVELILNHFDWSLRPLLKPNLKKKKRCNFMKEAERTIKIKIKVILIIT